MYRVVAEELVDGDGPLLPDPVHAVVRLLYAFGFRGRFPAKREQLNRF